MSIPDSRPWELKIDRSGRRERYIITDGDEQFEIFLKADAEKLLKVLEDYEEKMYQAWENSMDGDL